MEKIHQKWPMEHVAVLGPQSTTDGKQRWEGEDKAGMHGMFLIGSLER